MREQDAPHRCRVGMKCLCLLPCLLHSAAGAFAAETLRYQPFDADPGWEAHNNRIVPAKKLIVRQDFGFSATHFAGRGKGEIGGVIQRTTTPASYARKIAPLTLNDKIRASGTFAITASQPGAGLFFGFFNAAQPGGSGRPIGSLGLNLDFEHSGGRLAVRLITGTNKSCGTFITPYLPGKYRPTPVRKDGTPYHWTLEYDPDGATGNGQFVFTFRTDIISTHPLDTALPPASLDEAKKRFPHTTRFVVDVTPGLKKEGASFDRFGLQNMMKTGGSATIYFDDLTLNGEALAFDTDPEWLGSGNRATFEDREQAGAHDFGFSADTQHAGGAAKGEVGGGLWRSGEFAFYADRIESLGLDQMLEARGRVKLLAAGPDSDMLLGWFSSESKQRGIGDHQDFVGIHVGGPTRVGHYFIPQLATSKGPGGKVEHGPTLTPGRVFDWSLSYDPAANDGRGQMRVTLGMETVTLDLKPGVRQQGARLDRFGLFTNNIGGQLVKIYLDDLRYTAQK